MKAFILLPYVVALFSTELVTNMQAGTLLGPRLHIYVGGSSVSDGTKAAPDVCLPDESVVDLGTISVMTLSGCSGFRVR
ncbi:hypothetical protein C5L39_03390 [Corynebacterium alimapuense]|uniref:Uncharacterized protein n=1 Tax=Corynebacterium alimapuense TaxID=1576874 RepID=A0A3M8K8D1_9CORY|nr:hypothetical protein C5L39_03390 [Corynebacterium alimapuense]